MTELSKLVAALEAAWRAIRKHHPDVPDKVVINVGSRHGKAILGHFAQSRWATTGKRKEYLSEILIAAEGLNRPARLVFETLLHEAVHGDNCACKIKDTSSDGRYHNRRFAVKAEEFGLIVKPHPGIGCITTDVTDETAKVYAKEIKAIAAALKVARGGDPKKTKGRNRNLILGICSVCESKIRASAQVFGFEAFNEDGSPTGDSMIVHYEDDGVFLPQVD